VRTLVLVTALALLAPAARAQLAVITSLVDNNPTHRDVAAGIASVAAARFVLVDDAIAPDDAAACNGDVACFLRLGREHRASHVLVVGVAGAGRRDYVVALQLLAVEGPRVFEQSGVHRAGDDAFADGAAAGAPLARVEGPPLRASSSITPPATTAPTTTGSGVLGWTGAGLLATSGAIAVASTAWFMAAPPTRDDPWVLVGAVGGAAASVVLAGVGVVCIVVDER
jgi:hypothetical protein